MLCYTWAADDRRWMGAGGYRGGATREARPMTDKDEEYPSSFWRDRAEEARAKAAKMVSLDGKHSMLEIARIYDRLAAEAAEREARNPVKASSDSK
jgi:hypothetical protein